MGGQTGNAYGINRNPCGSSSGSGAAVSANLAAVALGTETDGSIVCPANAEGIVGIKPTVGLTSRAGVVPISHTQDTVGPHGRTVADAAAVLGVIQSRTFDGRDPATGGVPLGATGQKRPRNIPTDYTRFLNPNGLKGARLGLTRQGIDQISPSSINDAWEAAVAQIQAAGATVVDLDAANFNFPFSQGELLVLCFDFRTDLKDYFATRTGVPLAGGTLTDAIAFNNRPDIAPLELTFEDQVLWEICNDMAPGADDPQNDAFGVFGGETYNQALADGRNLAVNGIDLALAQFHLDAIIAPTGSPAWSTDLLFGDHFTLGSLEPGGAGRLSHRAGAGRNRARPALRHQLLRHRVQRADADQAGLGLRGDQPGSRAQPADARSGLPGGGRHERRRTEDEGGRRERAVEQQREQPRQVGEGDQEAQHVIGSTSSK